MLSLTVAKKWKASGAVFLALLAALLLSAGWNSSGEHRTHGERKDNWSGTNFAAQTDVELHPSPSSTGSGFEQERVWSGNDDWEPFVAADRSSSHVYQMTTRFNSKVSGIFIRSSSDGGETWQPDQLVGPITEWQADPQVAVAGDGTVFAVWLNGPNWRTMLIKSTDHGVTWSAPVDVAPTLHWTDHPWLVVSTDAQNVYVGVNEDDSYFVASHDGGQTFATPVRTSDTPGHWWCCNGGAIAPDGTVYYVVIDFFLSYKGQSQIHVFRSADKGATWQDSLVDISAAPPGCANSRGCTYGFFAPTAGLAIDSAGKILVDYNGGTKEKAPQALWVKTSTDGIHWSNRVQVSPDDASFNNGYPGAAAGPVPGDFRVVWQGNKGGDVGSWNTWFRRTLDGGQTWRETQLLSDRTGGAPYKNLNGYLFPYGDFLGLSVDGAGANHVIWAEGASYNGPGGSWYTRDHPDSSPR